MTDDTRALSTHDLETITAALRPVWFDLQSRGEQLLKSAEPLSH